MDANATEFDYRSELFQNSFHRIEQSSFLGNVFNTNFGKLKALSSKRTKSVNHRELLSIAAAFSLICEGGKRNGWCDFAKIVPKCHQMVHLKKYVGNFFVQTI